MASEIRVDTSKNTSGLCTVTYSNTGAVLSGITTASGVIDAQGYINLAQKIIHTGDADTSIEFPSNDTIKFETAGGERLRIKSDGEIGINTTGYAGGGDDPQLYVFGVGGGRQVKIHNPTAGTSSIQLSNATTGQGNDNGFQLAQLAGGDFYFEHQLQAKDIVFRTKPSGGSINEKLRITSDGQIGVNKTSPKEWHTDYRTLQIHDAGYIAGSADDSFVAIGANNYLDTGGSYDYTNSDFASQLYQVNGELIFRNAASGTADNAITWAERLRITSGGKVKIANHSTNDLRSLSVLAPKTQIQWGTAEDVGGFLMSENNGQFGLSGGGYWNGSSWVATYTGSAQIRHDGSGHMVFCTNASLTSGNNFTPSERLQITAAGIIKCGTSGVLKAEINNAVSGHQFISQCDDNNNGFEIYQQHGSTSTRNTLAVYDNRGNSGAKLQSFAVRGDGVVLMQATSSSGSSDDNIGFTHVVHGTSPYIRIRHQYSNSTGHTLFHMLGASGNLIGEIKQDGSGGVTYHSASDYRLKENVVDLTGAITRLKNLKPKRFNFKVNTDVTQDGFLAHELQEVVPIAVSGTKDEVVTDDSKSKIPTLADKDIGDPVYQTVDTSRVVPLLTAALQEAITKIETLETKVAALESS